MQVSVRPSQNEMTSSPGTIRKCRRFAVATRYPSSNAVTPINRSERASRTPLVVFSPSICPALSATESVTGCTGTAAINSCRNCRRIAFRSSVSARAAPCASSISVMTDNATSSFTGSALRDFTESLSRIPALALCRNQHAGIEYQSHAGGFRGSRCAATASATSRAKSSSIVAGESSGRRAMQSSMERRGGTGVCSTATVSGPSSITTSAPARTLARTPAKSRTASEAEMWIVAMLTIIPASLLPWATAS